MYLGALTSRLCSVDGIGIQSLNIVVGTGGGGIVVVLVVVVVVVLGTVVEIFSGAEVM